MEPYCAILILSFPHHLKFGACFPLSQLLQSISKWDLVERVANWRLLIWFSQVMHVPKLQFLHPKFLCHCFRLCKDSFNEGCEKWQGSLRLFLPVLYMPRMASNASKLLSKKCTLFFTTKDSFLWLNIVPSRLLGY